MHQSTRKTTEEVLHVCVCVCLCVNCFDLSAETSETYGLVAETFEHDNERLRFLTDMLILGQLKIFSF